MPTMLKRLLSIALFVSLATIAGAQYLQGKLQGGAGVPGTQSRSPLNSLERAANNLSGVTIVTDTFGNQRLSYYVRVLDTCVNYNPLLTVGNLPISSFVYQCGTQDSLFYIDWKSDAVLISVGGGASENWYNTNDTTTDLLRTAFVQRSAWWRGLDSVGFMRFSMRPDGFDGSQVTVHQDSVVVDADTILWSSSWHPTLQVQELQANGTYFYADSTKVVGIGQFPAFPSLNFDGTEKGYYTNPSGNGLTALIDGDGISGGYSYVIISQLNNLIELNTVPDVSGSTFSRISLNSTNSASLSQIIAQNQNATHGAVNYQLKADADISMHTVYLASKDTNVFVAMYLGESNSSTSAHVGRRAWGVNLIDTVSLGVRFDWIQSYLPNDTTENAISFYNRAYYFKNEHPIGAAGDTLFHFWAATGPGGEAGKDPGFITLDDIRAGVINWYNSNGTTTDNTRIATVTETATWLSNDVTADGVYPFRFELSGGGANEPENMVWLFPAGDSATLSQSDQELILFSSNQWLFKSNEATTVQADSFQYNPNLGGTAFRVGDNNVITQNAPSGSTTHRDAIEYRTITGTAQTELFLDGSADIWVVPTNSASNFKIHVAAICSAAGDGVGINTGDAWASWHLGGIKRVGSTTSLIGSVQAAATAQSDAGMSTSVVTIDADDTDESLRIRFTPPSTAGSTTVIRVVATIEISQTSY